jgi:hypothetical protein
MTRRAVIPQHPAADLIGRVPDGLLACLIGVTRPAIGHHRTARSIPPVDPRAFVDDTGVQAVFRAEAIAEVTARPGRSDALNAAAAAWIPGWVSVAPGEGQP